MRAERKYDLLYTVMLLHWHIKVSALSEVRPGHPCQVHLYFVIFFGLQKPLD